MSAAGLGGGLQRRLGLIFLQTTHFTYTIATEDNTISFSYLDLQRELRMRKSCASAPMNDLNELRGFDFDVYRNTSKYGHIKIDRTQ